jgi:RNA polymerase sigma factor (sigma-70 family)
MKAPSGQLRDALRPRNPYGDFDDPALLRAYVHGESQQAFAAIVERYVDLVYSSALRQLRDHHLAEDAAQAVFIILAQKAKTMTQRTSLPAWLFRATRYACANARKMQARRRHYETAAALAGNGAAVSTARSEATVDAGGGLSMSGDWDQVAPLLDGAIASLAEHDRQAVLLRYFAQRSLREVGEALGVSENAARMRVDRAVQKLRALLTRKGVTVAGVTLATLMAARGVEAAPSGLAGAATAATIAQGAVAAGSMAGAIAEAALAAMNWTKLKIAAVVIAVAVAGGAVTAAIVARPARPTVVQPAAPVNSAPKSDAGAVAGWWSGW